jgi:acyl-coenzyme A thioesterase PaaI-like protein
MSDAPQTPLELWLANVPFAAFAGVRFEPAQPGAALTGVLAYQDMLVGNAAIPALHGGAVGAFLEVVATAELVHQSGSATAPKPVSLTIDFLRSAGPRDLYARATVAKQGRRVVSVRAEAWQDTPAEPCAVLHGHFLVPEVEAD